MNFKILCLIWVLGGCFICSHADTLWGIKAAYTPYGSTTLMNMCAGNFRPMGIQMETAGEEGKYRYLRFGGKNGVVNAAMNEAGVAVVFSYADSNLDKKPRQTANIVGGSALCVEIVQNCRTAMEAVQLVEKAVLKQHRMMDSVIFLIADYGRIFAIECSPGHCQWTEQKGGFLVYAQCWHLPGMEFISTTSPDTIKNCYGREWAVRNNLSKRLIKNHDALSVSDSFAVARMGDKDVVDDGAVAPHEKNMLGSILFTVDDEYPEMLSTAYVAIGQPRGTLFFPIPMGLEKIPDVISDAKWQNAAVVIGRSMVLRKKLLEYERLLLKRYAELCKTIKSLELRNNHSDAVKRLNDFITQEALNACKMLQQLSQKPKVHKKGEPDAKRLEKTDNGRKNINNQNAKAVKEK